MKLDKLKKIISVFLLFSILSSFLNISYAENEVFIEELCSYYWYHRVEMDGSEEIVDFQEDGTFSLKYNYHGESSYVCYGIYEVNGLEVKMHFNSDNQHGLRDYTRRLKYMNNDTIYDIRYVLWELADTLNWGEYILYEEDAELPYYLIKAEKKQKNVPIKVILNRQELTFDQPPILDPEGRIMVPIRGIAEAMGDEVKWNQEELTALVRHRDRALIIPLNEYRILIAPSEKIADWSAYKLDVPSQERNGRTLTPVRAFCESLGATVIWNQDEMTAYITYEDNYMFDDLSDEAVEGINMDFSLIRNRVSFQEYTSEIYDFLESRNKNLDLTAIVWGGGIFDGFAQLFSGEEAMESAVKESLALVVAECAEMDMEENQIVNGVKFTKSGMEILQTLSNLPDGDAEIKSFKDIKKFAKTVPELENLATAIEDLGLYIDVTAFTIEELNYILADYSQNIKYLDDIEKYFRATGIDDYLIYDAIDDMRAEYTYKWIGLVNDIIAQGTDKGLTALVDYTTFGIFSIVNFAKDLSNDLTGLSTSADGLYEFYGVCRFNGAFDLAYNKMIENVTDWNFRTKDFIGLFKLQKAVKIQAYKSMNKIANRVEEVSWDNSIEKVKNMTYILWE